MSRKQYPPRPALETLEPEFLMSASINGASRAAFARSRRRRRPSRRSRITSGRPKIVRDGDSSFVRISLTGPGAGAITLTDPLNKRGFGPGF